MKEYVVIYENDLQDRIVFGDYDNLVTAMSTAKSLMEYHKVKAYVLRVQF